MKDLVNLNFLLRYLTGVDDMSKLQSAPYQLHTYENILAESIGIGSLFYAVGLYDMEVRETSGYHCSLFALGSGQAPVDYFSGIAKNSAQLVWDILTIYGGLDNTASSANTDIDYDAWSDWNTAMNRP